MKNLLKSIFSRNQFLPSEAIQTKLKEMFPDIVNVEWNKNGENYEAIFYKDQIEYIALLSENAELLEYKISLAEELLPIQIKENLLQKGEIMNAVLTNKGNAIAYEVIIRDTNLIRYLVHLTETGTIINEVKL